MSSPVPELLERSLRAAQAVTARCVRDIPDYQRLPAEVREADLVANVRAVLDLFATTVTEGRAPTEAELAAPVSWGAERARDGLPLDAVLRIYPLAAQEAWRIATEPGSGTPDPVLVDRMLGFLAEVMPRVALAYLRERAELDWTRREGRQHLAAALLAGRPAQRSAQRYGHRLADRYLVLAAHLPEPPADPDSRAATAWFRRVQVALDAQPDLLSSFDRDGAALLLPAPPDPAGQRAAVDGVLRRLSEAVGGDCRAGVALAADHAAIPDAHTLAAELAQLAGTLRRPPGGYWLDDLAVEYQLARPGPARACLAELLAPLRPNPHLLDALRAFIAAGYRRSEAAAALRVHRNTLTYRLHRVHALTGYDATAPRDAQLLTAAMTAHDIATTRPR